MARADDHPLLQGFSGQIGKLMVVKQYKNKMVIARYPRMDQVKPTKKQTDRRKIFKEAVAYAKEINNSKEKKAAYAKKLKKGASVYHAALSEFLKLHGGKGR
ncbi:MAG: hypothetical protein K0Q66_801 [Chitinophagaceae bacterium]|jgi:hypothetical protein|nr:hypothetical protein [Chitinophagaceae bacterium]